MIRLDLSQSCSKGVRYFLVLYAALSIIFTAQHFYSSHHSDHSALAGDSNPIFPRGDEELVIPRSADHQPISPLPGAPAEPKLSTKEPTTADKHTVLWTDDNGVTESMPKHYVLSKIFADALGPTNLTPYYRRAKVAPEKDDITMATLVTRNRFNVLSRLASHYKGPISAAIHINDDETKDEVMDELHAVYANNLDMQDYVDIHLIVDNFDRQFNMWRNVAKFFSRTDYIMMLDVDFQLCTDFRQRIRSSPEIMSMLASGRAALVVPAFEYVYGDDGLDWRTFPTNKADLLQEVEAGKLDMFHKSWLKGHGSTNYTKWYESSDLYKVTDYNFSYEPYIIYKKDSTPWCDERFIGYGANKAACLYEIFLSGIDYWVLPEDFLIHQTHQYPEETRRKERQYNRKLYSNFREELCLRYARQFIATNEWDSPRADNLKEECQKIRGFRAAMNLPTVA